MNTWALSLNGVRTVVELELSQRIRSRRWIWALAAWFVLIGGITTLVILAVLTTYGASTMEIHEPAMGSFDPPAGEVGPKAGPLAFGLITYLVLGMGLMIAPAFTATSINGDRSAGTLATLQATRLSAVDLATGKLIAAWCTAAVFLVVASPFIAWSMLLGNISVWQVLVVFLVVLAEVAVVCAIGLGWSALISRPAGAAAMTYLSVVALAVLSVLVFVLAMTLTTEQTTLRVWGLTEQVLDQYNRQTEEAYQKDPDADPPPAPVDKCTWFERPNTVMRYDKVWWLLVGNPFVVIADAAPLPPGASADLNRYSNLTSDPMATIRYGVRKLSLPPVNEVDDCASYYSGLPGYNVEWDDNGNAIVTTAGGTVVNTSPVKIRPVNVETPVWPWGLGFHVLLGAAFFWIAVRRLAVPYRKLAPGTRVA
jgi:ABC-type transport system involved in multi-copper enzyme maturation permease subunit